MTNVRMIQGVLIITVMIAAAACSDDEIVDPGPASGFTITGTIEVAKQINVPEDAELYAVWSVSSGSPDYAIVAGKGVVDLAAGTFSITFDTPPPATALNDFNNPQRDSIPLFGVGYLILSRGLQQDSIMTGAVPPTYGVVAESAVIYIDGDPDRFEAAGHRPWLSAFPKGYGFGKRKVEGENTFDSIIPTGLNSMKLIISDDWKDYKLPNWT